ncbi:Cys-tRNA(Pro) deacylase [Neisseria meningitidis]|nr:Cys-tRNA(Pro) deacylase [Neisseria meningitidis]MBH5568677.1 Cys-tRNA(Pro) deacylase [Neisseria meningitidis]MBH5572600.1 Cys-tRNA(Pro) deacylase [Neisseria meningitidis]MBH6479232.1 Cys-tRNA(Pro) deacylase [Neisseria meningitidis]
MSKLTYPITPAVRVLRENGIEFEPFTYAYEEHGGTAQFSRLFGKDEHLVIKTIVLQDENGKGLIVLMHGDKQISTRNLARHLGAKHIEPATPAQANKWTGYLVGGTTPFGIRTKLDIYVEQSVMDLETIYINGGKRGFIIGIRPGDLNILNPKTIQAAV